MRYKEFLRHNHSKRQAGGLPNTAIAAFSHRLHSKLILCESSVQPAKKCKQSNHKSSPGPIRQALTDQPPAFGRRQQGYSAPPIQAEDDFLYDGNKNKRLQIQEFFNRIMNKIGEFE